MVQETIQDRTGSGHVAQKFAPFLQWPVAGHDGGPVFIPAHDHFKKMLTRVLGQLLQAKIVNNQKFRVEVTPQRSVLLIEGFVFHEIAHQIEDGTVKHLKVHFYGFIADGLSQMCRRGQTILLSRLASGSTPRYCAIGPFETKGRSKRSGNLALFFSLFSQ